MGKVFYKVYGLVAEIICLAGICLDKLGIEIFPDFSKRIIFSKTQGKKYWFHAASVGEIRGIFPLIKLFLDQHSADSFLVTTTSISGKKEAERLIPGVNVYLAPFDSPSVVRKFLRVFSPKFLFVNETELWPAMILESARVGTRCFLINGRISDKTYPTYKALRLFFSLVLSQFEKLFVQTNSDRDRFRAISLGTLNLMVAGSTKFDFPLSEKNGEFTSWWQKISASLCFQNKTIVVSFGSIREDEETEIIISIRKILNEKPNTLIVVVPRHVERFAEIKSQFVSEGITFISRTDSPELVHKQEVQLIIVDKIGELLDVYKNSDLCVVGGTFSNVGGHNILEPAYFNKPIIVGPDTSNMREIANDMEASGGLIKVENGSELAKTALSLLEKPDRMFEMGKSNGEINYKLKGVSKIIYQDLCDL